MKAAVVLLALLFAAQAPPVARHWAKGQTIRVWIDTLDSPPNGETLVTRAMRTWTHAADGRFTLEKMPTAADAPVRVHFMAADYRYGVTSPRVDRQTGLILRAEVAVAADAGRTPLERSIIVYLTALHELGHALGLEHTTDISTIMYLFREPGDGERFFGAYARRARSFDDIGSDQATGLSLDDVAALRKLYDGPPITADRTR
jgi:matrixin